MQADRLIKAATEQLTAAGCESPRLDSELLLAAVLDVERSEFYVAPEQQLSSQQLDAFNQLLERRLQREPLAYILGYKDFRRIRLAVDRRVLIPRPDTELLVELALELPQGTKVLDLGTGSGAIALALKDERPDLEITGSDRSPDAVALASKNASQLGLRVGFKVSDLFDDITESYGALISNPPYVESEQQPNLAPEIREFEPATALFAGSEGLDIYRRLMPQAAVRQIPVVILEIGYSQAEQVSEICSRSGYRNVSVHRDLAGRNRAVFATNLENVLSEG